MEISVDIHPKFIDHFKSQLMYYEVSGDDIKILFDGGGFQDRHSLMTELVKRSFSDFPSTKSLRFWVFTGDNRPTNKVNGQPLFSISGPRVQSDFVIPDPHIVRWPQVGVEDFVNYCETLRNNSVVKPLYSSIVWRGSSALHPIREFVTKECSKLNNPEIDIKDVPPETTNESFVHMKDLTQWAILCDMPGRGFSGRLKYLLHAYRPTVVFERHEWDAITMLLEPGEDFVLCPPDMQVFSYTVSKILSQYERFLVRSKNTSDLMVKLTERRHVSSLLVKKIVSGVQ